MHQVGKIIADKEINFKTINNVLMGIWKNLKGLSISEVGRNKVLISIEDKRRRQQILKGGHGV
ncbi:hypothetical protein AHAS_Ahas16G0064500 [Arachis hypogaea]